MSIKVHHLTKVYGSQYALRSVSFAVESGEIVGFLGPNGAGKSTTFKIATGYLPPTEGSVSVAGFDVVEQVMEVKKVIGYLPEHNPLYLDMFVHEYLQFIGGLYGMKGAALKMKVGEMVERCGLTGEQNKKIETLSKGYRQRVGLAQALLHNPKVLILDEPTSGLDPNQLVEIRKLIKEVSEHKTVIFSTHIMQEVEALCDRVVIINKGEIVADDKVSNLIDANQRNVFVVEFEEEINVNELSLLQGVESIVQLPSLSSGYRASSFKVFAKEGVDIRAEFFRYAADKSLSLIGLKQEQQTIESIFQELTKQRVEA
jgi:ABC-2 type transport system ATP-binding protein